MRDHPRRKDPWPAVLCLLALSACLLSGPASAKEVEDDEDKPPEAPPVESAECSVVVISSPAPKPPKSLLGEPRSRGFLGYGFLITADGLVATCDSVLPENLADQRVYLTDVNGETYWGEVLKRDAFAGFAILRMTLPDLRLRISLLKPSPRASTGEPVVLLRSPATTATPDAEARLGRIEDGGEGISVYHLDSRLHSRAEGFPVIDREGRFVGIAGRKSGFPSAGSWLSNSASKSSPQRQETPYIAAIDELVVVPGQRLLDFVNEWLEEEKNRILRLPAEFAVDTADSSIDSLLVPRIPSGQELERVFGLSIADLDDELTEEFGLAPGAKGIVITGIEPEGPASRAGLARGLVIYQIGSYEVSTLNDVSDLAQKLPDQELTEFVIGKELVRANNISQIFISRKYLNAR